MPQQRRAKVVNRSNPFEERTKRTFDQLRSGEANIDDISMSQLKSYFTGLGFFKQEELVHYQLIQHEIERKELYQHFGKDHKRQQGSTNKAKEQPKRHLHQQNFGRRMQNWFKGTFTCLRSSSSNKPKLEYQPLFINMIIIPYILLLFFNMPNFQRQTNGIFNKLQSGELSTINMSTSYFKRYMTGLACFKKTELLIFSSFRVKFMRGWLVQALKSHIKEEDDWLPRKRRKKFPKEARSSSKEENHLGTRINKWFFNTFTCLKSSKKRPRIEANYRRIITSMIPSHSNSYSHIETLVIARTVLFLLFFLIDPSHPYASQGAYLGFSNNLRIKIIQSKKNHMSLRKVCTWDRVFTVLSPLNLKVPPLKVLVKLLLQGKYFYWIQNSAGLLFPQFMLLVRQIAGPTLSPCYGYCEYPFVT